ncbi:MAG TPA: hypothetical protein VD969_27115 [Symbiobacteriaceae bacterium]|nr:hypothetical protein [Symbiobacteriaceae bacterium]
MSCAFSSRFPRPISCDQPELTVSFPVLPAGANTVVLANGAVVDLNELGRIIARVCPAIVCQPNVVQTTTMQALAETIQAAPIGTGQTVDMSQVLSQLAGN